MMPLPQRCPFTGGEIVVTRVYCPDVDVTLEGRFAVESAALCPAFGRATQIRGDLCAQ